MRSLKIDRKRNTIEIRLNSSLYSERTILDSITDFGKLCSAGVRRNGAEVIVELKCAPDVPGKDLDRIGHEFCNYALGLMKTRAEV